MRYSLLFILLLTASFFAPALLLTTDQYVTFVNEYGFSGKNLLEKPYVLLTSIFIHSNLVHLLSNIFVFFFFGIAVESELGPRKMFSLLFLGAFLGDVMSLLIYPFDAISIGASGGVFAVVGAGILVRPFDFSFYPYFMPIPLALLGLIYAAYNVYGFFFDANSNISYIAHFGGLFVGFIYGFYRQGVKRSLIIILISLLILTLIPLILF